MNMFIRFQLLEYRLQNVHVKIHHLKQFEMHTWHLEKIKYVCVSLRLWYVWRIPLSISFLCFVIFETTKVYNRTSGCGSIVLPYLICRKYLSVYQYGLCIQCCITNERRTQALTWTYNINKTLEHQKHVFNTYIHM